MSSVSLTWTTNGPGDSFVQEGGCPAARGCAPGGNPQEEPTAAEQEDLLFAWRAVKHVKSNAIVVAKGKRTLRVGAGGQIEADHPQLA